MVEITYTEALAYEEQWEFVVAWHTEIDIEASCLKAAEPNEKEVLRKCLRLIDKWKTEGVYATEVEKLRRCFPLLKLHFDFRRLRMCPEAENFMLGLKSPDPAQRKRFKEFADATEIWDKTPAETIELLRPLEKAKRRKGNVALCPPWRDANSEMDQMRILTNQGFDSKAAAMETARKRKSAQPINRARHLLKLFEKKQALRESET